MNIIWKMYVFLKLCPSAHINMPKQECSHSVQYDGTIYDGIDLYLPNPYSREMLFICKTMFY